ncbi:hypothetical protein VPH5P1C_0025 [Vibrio phage 5P1c]
MDNNFILCTIEDAWKEFERGGEISNSADNLLSVVTELMERDKRCKVEKPVSWQDVLSEYVISTGLPYSCNGNSQICAFNWDGDEETFLEMCRVVLRTTGELK